MLDAAEDLSLEGLSAWRGAIDALSQELESVRLTATGQLDRAVCTALGQFLAEQRLRVAQQPYETQTTPYIQLAALGLFPFAVIAQSPHHEMHQHGGELLLNRMHACTEWLAQARGRLEQGQLILAPEARQMASRLRDATVSLMRAWADRFPGTPGNLLLSEAAERFVGGLDWLSNAPDRVGPAAGTGTARSAPSPESLLRAVYGSEESMQWWLEQFSERTDAVVAQIGSAGPPRESPGITVKRSELPGLLTEIYLQFRCDMGDILAQQAPAVRIAPLPHVGRLLVPDAVYLPGVRGRREAVLMLNLPEQATSTFSSRNWAYLLSVLTHELCPGHHEQFFAGESYGVKGAHDVLQSSAGAEGWAVHAEELALSMPDRGIVPREPLVRLARAQRLRRLMAGLLWTLQNTAGAEVARLRLQAILRLLPADEAEIVQSWGWPPLHYAIGLVQTEEALRDLRLAAPGMPPSACNSLYLSAGPLLPSLAVQLALVRLEGSIGAEPPQTLEQPAEGEGT